MILGKLLWECHSGKPLSVDLNFVSDGNLGLSWLLGGLVGGRAGGREFHGALLCPPPVSGLAVAKGSLARTIPGSR